MSGSEAVEAVEAASAKAVDDQLIDELVGRAQAEGLQLTGEGGLLQQLTKRLLESALEGEITDHLGYDKHDPARKDGGNSRNGKRSKTVLPDIGPVEITVPRDRDGSFEPKIVRKRQNGVLLDGWRQVNRRPRPRRGRPTAVVEVLFDEAGQELLQELSGIPRSTLAQALPTWQQGPAAFAAGGTPRTGPDGGRVRGGSWPGGLEAGRVRFQDACTFGSVALACRLCTARRTGRPVHAVRYLPLWSRVCHRHQRWQSDAGPGHAGQPGRLDVAASPEIGHAQQHWPALARHAVGRGHDPRQAFALARTIVLRWWQHAPAWQAERIWPTRVHRLTHGAASDSPETVWSASVRDAAVLPETIVLAQTLTDPAWIRLAHTDRDNNRPAGWGAGGRFIHHLGHRLNRPWLGPLLSVDYTSPLHAWTDTAAPQPTTSLRT